MMMVVIGRWMPTLGLAACLAVTGCKKDEPTTPTNTPPPTVPAARTVDAGAGTVAEGGASPAPNPPPPPAPPPPASQPAPSEDPKNREWTAGLVDVKRSNMMPVTLREVRTARNEGFDRLVLQFDGDQLPGYHLEYIDKPVIKCGSGDPTDIAGQGWLQVRIQPAQAHENGQVTVTERERKPKLPVFQELELTCDFEGEVSWVLGVKHPNKYRVMELREPTRLVVDVQH